MNVMLFYIAVILMCCNTQQPPQADITEKFNNKIDTLQQNKDILETRFPVPNGYKRIAFDTNSFAYYLRNLPLKPKGSLVHYYDGRVKQNYGIYEAVVDMDIGKKNLVQCADAVMKLRAEYLYSKGKYNEIKFHLTNGFLADYATWIKGNRIVFEGNKAFWKNKTQPSNTYEDFQKYMEVIYSYAGTLSLSKELMSKQMKDMECGDVFIIGGSPGHAVIVVDIAQNGQGEKIFILAQSYMPAQEIQILANPNNPEISPWYYLKPNEDLITPEWNFKNSQLKSF